MINHAHGDFETRGTVDLTKTGTHVYADDPNTAPWCFAWCIGDGPIHLWTPDEPGRIGDLFAHLDRGGIFVAHNASFELPIWNRLMTKRYGWPPLPVEQVRCTMAMAFALALPGSLEKAAEAVHLDIAKDMAGSRLMKQMAKPRRIEPDGTIVWWDDQDRRERLYAYCKQDVEVERRLEKRLLPLSVSEQALWVLDQRINDRGIRVDLPAIRAAMNVVEDTKTGLDQRMAVTTGGWVSGCSKVQDLTDWIIMRGVPVDGVAKADIVDLLAREDLPGDVRLALELRRDAAKSSTAKLKAMTKAAGADARCRGVIQYHGANTGRFASRRIQVQNFPRPTMKQEDIEEVLAILSGALT